MCVCVCVCVYISIYIDIYIYLYTHIFIYTHTRRHLPATGHRGRPPAACHPPPPLILCARQQLPGSEPPRRDPTQTPVAPTVGLALVRRTGRHQGWGRGADKGRGLAAQAHSNLASKYLDSDLFVEPCLGHGMDGGAHQRRSLLRRPGVPHAPMCLRQQCRHLKLWCTRMFTGGMHTLHNVAMHVIWVLMCSCA